MTATPPPQRIADRYTVRGIIGEGGMGSVYQGVDDVTGVSVAIKRLKPEILAADPGMLARFDREAEALRRLNHPNIVQVLATETEGEAHYIIMEYVGGGSLRDLLDESAPDVTRTLQIALELADALSRAHHLRIIHRDIKPANVLLAEDGAPRLTDFGVAYMEARERMTQTGMAVGTLDYLSPEGLDGAPADARADIWAFGVMLFEMLAGERPFAGTSAAQVVTAILTQPVPDLTLFNPDTPDMLVDLINRMLAKDPAERIPSTRQVGAELEAILRGDSTPLPSRFQTPTPSEVKLPDTATTIAPATPTPLAATTAVTSPEPAGGGGRLSPRGWLMLLGGLAAAVVIVVLIVLFDSGVFDGEDDTPEAAAVTEAAEATPEVTAVVRDDGWVQMATDRVSVYVPPDWIDIQEAGLVDSALEMMRQIGPGAEFLELYGENLINNMEVFAGNIVTFDGVVISWENFGVEIPDGMVEARARELVESVDLELLEFETVTVPFSSRTAVRALERFQVEDDQSLWSLTYLVPVGTRFYTVMFYGLNADFPEQIPVYDAVLATIEIAGASGTPVAEATADVTPEATVEVVEATPAPTAVIREDGWQVLTGGRVTVAVPPDWLDLQAAGMTQTMIDMISQIEAAAQFIETYGDQYFENIGIAAGNAVRLTGLVVTWEEIGVVMADSMVHLRAQQLIEGLGTSAVIEELEPVTLPFGTGSRWLVQAGDAEDQLFWQYGFYVGVGTRIYTIGFFGAGENFREQIPLFDEVIATMRIAESDEPAEATAEPTP
jgi:serine/threonine-protein kinase